MIVTISIADNHKGGKHVGTIQFEIPGIDAGASHYSVLTLVCPVESEHLARAMGLGVLMNKEQLEDAGGPVIRMDQNGQEW